MQIPLRPWQRCCTALAVALCSLPAIAATPPKCQAPEQRQFDFWLGRWTVFDTDGSTAGENTIERIDDGCVLIEHWRGADGLTGTSLNSWHAGTRQWHQHWVDNQGSLLRLAGTLQDGRMVLAGTTPDAKRPGTTWRHRITWTPAADGSVRQHWQRSDDDGASWATVFDGRYVRRP